MTTHHVDSKGVIQFSLIDTPMDAPWFRKVAAEAEARLDKIYQTNPESLSTWYLKYREQKDVELSPAHPDSN